MDAICQIEKGTGTATSTANIRSSKEWSTKGGKDENNQQQEKAVVGRHALFILVMAINS